MNKFKEAINAELPVLVDFFAEWCGPCKTMAPVLSEVKRELGDSLRIIKVDVDKNPGVAGEYQVRGVPTFILFRRGEVLWRASGAMPGTELKRLLSSKLHQGTNK